ncbi:MAG: SpoIID/LytB domain-containing protein [Myxococcales bacterium]|nr:SpoIID/LytB domain-containing protein [Myxococcales bacterium]USN51061.1 MAG: SpoIID/LytB domain-containing protein [Myxococcales bacterium]
MTQNFQLLIFTFILAATIGCSLKINNSTHPAPTILVKHHGKIISLDLEKYVAAVLAGEVHESWPMEALKAQAIAARTFALLRMQERKNRPFHTQSSVTDQVFKHHESQKLTKAAKETRGIVLTYRGRLIEASFHSTCGGHTCDSKSVWGKSYDYLQGVPCSYCSNSPTFRWKQSIPLPEVEQKLKQKISFINVLQRGPYGRVLEFLIKGNRQQEIKGQTFRTLMGTMRIKSTMITNLSIKNNTIIFSGQGFGHGVGMCQYGALGMAKMGKNTRQILLYYYPHTKLAKIY